MENLGLPRPTRRRPETAGKLTTGKPKVNLELPISDIIKCKLNVTPAQDCDPNENK